MLCQNCNKQEADKIFVINQMGKQYYIHLCSDCLHEMWKYANSAGQGEFFKMFSGWWPGKEEPRQSGTNPFPDSAEKDLKTRRRLAALHERLREAAEQENYEEAARLRDHIAAVEREACTHDS